MVARLTAWLLRLASRRAIAVACVLAIVAAGLGHMHHFDMQAKAGHEVSSLVDLDGSSDAGSQLIPSVDHCHSCQMTAVFAEILVPDAPATGGIVTVVLPPPHTHLPIFENPPPIA